MQNRRAAILPILLLSVLGASFFGVLLMLRHSSNRVYNLTLATGGKNGQYYAFGETLAKVVNHHHPKIQLKVLETDGSLENIELLNQNKAQLALVQSDVPLTLSIQLVSYLFPEVFHLVATRNSGIQTVSDLQDKQIAIMPEGSGSNQLFWQLSQHYGFTTGSFEAIPFAPDDAYTALKNGYVDALFRVLTLGTSGMTQLLQSGENILVPIDQSAALQLFQPALETSEIPRGTYNGSIPIPPDNLQTVSVRALLVTREDVPELVIHEIAKTLFEARNELVTLNPQAALIRQPESLQELGFSFHPGAKRYYTQDDPSFLERYAEPIGLGISTTVLVGSALWQFKLWLQRREKNRADLHNMEILNLLDQIPKIDDVDHLEKFAINSSNCLKRWWLSSIAIAFLLSLFSPLVLPGRLPLLPFVIGRLY